MSKNMAEVILGHWSRSTHTDSKPPVDKCDGCGEVVHTWGEPTDPNEGIAAHQAAALSAAGFGLVADAKAEAWDEAYKLGVDDERTSQANPGIAGCFCHGSPCHCFIAPARVNPYRATP
jgi:hypothetical protein